jgi:DNA helicase-2/ATP-dependent DNA helicase PcrA
MAHKLAIWLRQGVEEHPEWRLPELADELKAVAQNKRRFWGLGDEEMGFDPDAHKGQVVVATMHKAKGLEWDRVYLMSVNNYDFPSGQPYDTYIAEKWFLQDGVNLQAEALAQLQALIDDRERAFYAEGQATGEARLDYVRERLRLFYVGITRARRELVVTWNIGRRGDQLQSLPFVDLQAYWEERLRDLTA